MRLVGGRWRGRRLSAPEGRDTVRPTADRTREAVFNVLLHRFQGRGFQLVGAPVCDLFAGTGALGLEALSRGAGHVTFVERAPQALAALRANLRTLAVETAEASVVAGDALRLPSLSPPARPCTLAFLDPPYAPGALDAALVTLAAAGWLAPGAVVVAEHAADGAPTPPAGYALADTRRYGKAQVTFLRWEGRTPRREG